VKLRLQANAVRLRLNQAEVARLSSAGFIDETIEFPGSGRLSYAIHAATEHPAICARLEEGILRIDVPLLIAREWASTNRVGIEASPGAGPSILIEKDFQCLHGDEPPDPGAYPNPRSEVPPVQP